MGRLRGLYDPDAVLRGPPGWPESGPYVGRDAVMRAFGELREVWRDSSSFVLADELIDAGDRVVVHVNWHIGVRGLPLDQELAWVYTVRGRLIVSLEIFTTLEEALEAAGLPD